MPELMRITLYDPETNEVKGEFSRSIVPWGIMKRAIRLAGKLDKGQMTDDVVDELTGLVVDVFGRQFTAADLENGAEVSEMLTVLNTVIAKAGALAPNPTPPG